MKAIKWFITSIVCLLSINCLAGTPIAAGLAPMLPKVLPAVVNIRAAVKVTDITTLNRLQKERGANNQNGDIPETFLSVGSGVIVDPNKGYIMTNAHVINDAQIVTVTLGDGHHYTAKIIGLDKPSDVAVLQIKAKNLTSITMGDSNNLKVGDTVAAIGNPFGLNQTVTSGIISALGRTTLGIENYENFIQTDAPINPGNSGGALINMQGELIGINTAILAPDRGSIGIGFAIPSNMAKSIMQQLIDFGDVRRGTLGIGAQDITPDIQAAFNLKNTNGAAVTLVKIDSPASKAGLEAGDVITAINNTDIKNANDVVNTIGALRVNSKISIAILRMNKPLILHGTLSDPKDIKAANQANDPFFYGVALNNFTLLSPIHGLIKGVLVVSVEPDSHAWQADLRPGDVIYSINQQKVADIDELKKAANTAKSSILLNVLRDSGAIFISINKEDS
ncbi:MAG: Do family serine endopeptidase [Gammaproteobacteria bacterium]|nr:Do family serine endopeptidase [Gammaproteobacteria bacterium]